MEKRRAEFERQSPRRRPDGHRDRRRHGALTMRRQVLATPQQCGLTVKEYAPSANGQSYGTESYSESGHDVLQELIQH